MLVSRFEFAVSPKMAYNVFGLGEGGDFTTELQTENCISNIR